MKRLPSLRHNAAPGDESGPTGLSESADMQPMSPDHFPPVPTMHWPELLNGLSDLAVQGVLSVSEIVEAMHQTIKLLPLPIPRDARAATRRHASGLSGFVYRRVRDVTGLVGKVLASGIRWTAPQTPAPLDDLRWRAFRAALNGVYGDYLAESGNPLAQTMQIQAGTRSSACSTQAANPCGNQRLLLIHGLCMHPGQWQRLGHDHGARLASEFGYRHFYLSYNSGVSVPENGAALSELLERWLVVDANQEADLRILAHSMGGLLARSALQHACVRGLRWPSHLRAVVCLGTPHHGAPLERAGAWLDRLIGFSPYSAPLWRVGGNRSAGIKDLRHGRITAGQVPPTPTAASAVSPFSLCLLAGTRAPSERGNDGLVPIASALGRHTDPTRNLDVPEQNRTVVTRCGHFDLLSDQRVYHALRKWLAPDQ